MGAFRTLVISLVLGGGFVLWCQSNAENPLEEAKRLDQQGQFTKAIEEVLRIMNSRHLSDSQLSRAFVLLGYAYQEEGEFKQAQRAYERALPLLQMHQAPSDEYAEALESLADLYQKMGNAKAAVKLGRQALGIYESTSQHASVARACRNLAMWELSEGRRKDGSKYLAQAIEEAKNTQDLDEDFFAAVSSTQGWLEKLAGNFTAEADYDQRAVDLWIRKHGEEYMDTGWGYLLLGDAHIRKGEKQIGLEEIRKGLAILERTLGSGSPKYIIGEIAYAHALDQTGAHKEAARLKHAAEERLAALYHGQCVDCSINVTALR